MSKWILVNSVEYGREIVQECDLRGGPAAMGSDVEYDSYMGDRVAGVVLYMDRSKKKVEAERTRMEETMGGNGIMDRRSRSPSGSGPSGRRTRSRSASSVASGQSGQRGDTPRPTMVGRPPSGAGRKRVAVVGSSPSDPPSSSRARLAAPSDTPRVRQRAPRPVATPVVTTGGAASASNDALLRPPGQGMTPLVPQSQLPHGFSLSGTTPLALPAHNDEASFRQFMMSSMVSLHSEIAGIKMMTNNLYIACYPLIVQSANKATGALQEVTGTRDRLLEVGTAVNKVETAMQKMTAQIGKDHEFKYEPFSTKGAIDAIDKHQILTVLATDIEREIYNETDEADAEDLLLALKDRTNKAKAAWLVEVVLHRRMVSTSENLVASQRLITRRINQYASDRRRNKRTLETGRQKSQDMAARRAHGSMASAEDMEEDEAAVEHHDLVLSDDEELDIVD